MFQTYCCKKIFFFKACLYRTFPESYPSGHDTHSGAGTLPETSHSCVGVIVDLALGTVKPQCKNTYTNNKNKNRREERKKKLLQGQQGG